MDEILIQYASAEGPLPAEHALWPLNGRGFENLGHDGRPIDVPMPHFGPDELLVRHDAFEETVTDARTGQTGRAFFNLWTDAEGRALKFGSTRTVGLREGYEDLASLAAATREQVFPPTAPR